MALRIAGSVERPAPVAFTLDGRPIEGIPGESLAAALLAADVRQFRAAPRTGAARGPLCLMGICSECVLRVDGRVVAACLEPVRAGIDVRLGTGI
jgi:predicted molibdopterin-dependent oxidoreductase YjgC